MRARSVLDARVTSTVKPTEEAMKGAGRQFFPNVYDGAGHGFLRQQDGKNGKNMEACENAWPATLDFLRKHTEGK